MYHFQNCESSSQSSSETDIAHSPCTCCKCKNDKKHLIKGKFGLAYIVETPKVKMTTPVGWQIEFEDTPSGVINDCNKMVEWVSYPPLENCKKHFPEFPPACAKILKPRNNLLLTPKQHQCVFKSDIKDNSTNTHGITTDLSHTKNCCENVCNCGENKYNGSVDNKIPCCREKSTQNPSRNSCSHQNSKKLYDNQNCCFNTDHPMHYQGCYWYTDKDVQHCWCTTQKIGMTNTNEVETKDDSTSYNPEQSLDYVPSRESKNNSAGQIIRVVNRETQYQDKSPSKLSTGLEEGVIKRVSNKQVGTNSKEGIRVSIDEEMIARSNNRSSGSKDDNLGSVLTESTLEKIMSIAKRAIKNDENSNRSSEGAKSLTVTESSLEKMVSKALKDSSRTENSNQSSIGTRDNRNSITENSLEKIISNTIKDGINRSSTVTEHSLGQIVSNGNRLMKEGNELESMQQIQNKSSVMRSTEFSERANNSLQREMSEQDDKLVSKI